MRIIQHTACLSPHDAISNDIIEIDKILKNLEINSEIYADAVDEIHKGRAKESLYLRLRDDDILILHVSTYSDFYNYLENTKCKKVFFYHNITPPKYLIELNADVYENSLRGLEQAEELLKKVDYVCADSEYNATDLRKMGWEKEISVIPIIYDFTNRSNISEDKELKNTLTKTTNILFVGRLVPNKRQDDILKAFIIYNKFFNPNSILHLVGGHVDTDLFVKNIFEMAKLAGIENRIKLPGKVGESELVTYYRNCDVFLSMSEHEGFSVPMIETMYYGLPVIAYLKSGALPETLGNAGIFFEEKSYREIAFLMDEVIHNEKLRLKMKANMVRQLKNFEYETVKQKLINFLRGINVL